MNDPSTGYFYRIKPYAGKAPGEAPVQGLGTKVVIDRLLNVPFRRGQTEDTGI